MLCALATACALYGVESSSGEHFPRSPSGLLEYANHLHDFNDEQLTQEKQLAEAALQRFPKAFDHIRLALVLMQPDSVVTDYERAEALLKGDSLAAAQRAGPKQGPGNPSGDGSYRILALFLLENLEERRERQALSDRLAEEQRKLEELRAIERQLNDTDTW